MILDLTCRLHNNFFFSLSISTIIMDRKNNSNHHVDWIEKAICENCIKYYNYNGFNDVQEINSGPFGKIFTAKWKDTDTTMVLKSSYKFLLKK